MPAGSEMAVNSEELMSDDRLPPPSVSLFLKNFLKSSKHITRNIRKLVDSYSSDFIHSVSKGEVSRQSISYQVLVYIARQGKKRCLNRK